MSLHPNEITGQIVDASFHIHKELGPSLHESAYERALEMSLRQRGFLTQRQVPVPVVWDHEELGEAFRADLIVDDRVIVEIKAIEKLAPVHAKQLITYLRLTGMTLGLLLNFGAPYMKDGIRRLVNGFDESPGASEFPCRSDKHSAQRRKDAEGRASEHLEVGENESAGLILDSAYTIHSSLGPGLLASVYERALEAELLNAGCRVDRQVPFALNWDGKDLGEAFRADLVVNGRVLVEVKSQEILVPVCAKCVSTYLKISGLRLGLLLNFGSPLLKDGITRVVHGLPD